MSTMLNRVASLFAARADGPLARGELPVTMSWLGAVAVALALGFNPLGSGSLLDLESNRLAGFFAGLGILLAGLVLDLTIGQRRAPAWFRDLARAWPQHLKFASQALQLGLLVLVIRQFDLEHQAFSQ